MRTKFTLRCVECKMENYITKKNKNLTPDKVEFIKYCPKCNKHTTHKEKSK
ncbi:MAG: 50S ribosomal protein L33 [Tenericutes bacterium]|nr:MAG: 50S ribosomal protein L33 [Mycoplasmatota bacterium]